MYEAVSLCGVLCMRDPHCVITLLWLPEGALSAFMSFPSFTLKHWHTLQRRNETVGFQMGVDWTQYWQQYWVSVSNLCFNYNVSVKSGCDWSEGMRRFCLSAEMFSLPTDFKEIRVIKTSIIPRCNINVLQRRRGSPELTVLQNGTNFRRLNGHACPAIHTQVIGGETFLRCGHVPVL